MARKKFGISQNINQGITEIMNNVDHNSNTCRYSVIPLSKIEIDPDNPRELFLTPKDVNEGISDGDVHVSEKKLELLNLDSLAATIEKEGVINPIVVYKSNENYRLIAGERRFLASLMAKQEDISAKIVLKKPDPVTLRLLQWIENNERKDLSLKEKINNLNAIIKCYLEIHPTEKLDLNLLRNLTGLSKTQTSLYLLLLRGPSDLTKVIEEGRVDNLEKAALIAGIENSEVRAKMLYACVEGESLRNLKKLISQEKLEKKDFKIKKQRGRKQKHINLGRINDSNVIKKIFEIIFSNPKYQHLKSSFDMIDYSQYKQVEDKFQKLLVILSKNN